MPIRYRSACAAVIPMFFACWWPTTAFARQSPADEPPPRLEATAQATLLATTGNTSSQALGAGGEVIWRPKPWEIRARAAFAQTETDDVLSTRSTVGLFRADRFLTPRTSVYGQYDFLRDIFAGIEHRSTIAGGVAYRLVDAAPHLLTIDGGIGFEHEDRVGEDSEQTAVATAGIGYKWSISETSTLSEDFRFVQGLEAADDWKLDQTASLTAAITSVISLKVSNIVRYVNEPVPGFESTDTITAVALVWTLKRPGP